MSQQKPKVHLGMIGSAGHGKATLNAAIGKVMEDGNPSLEPNTRKYYIATLRGHLRTVGAYAENGTKARDILECKFGKGNILFLHLVDGDGCDIPRIRFLTEDDTEFS